MRVRLVAVLTALMGLLILLGAVTAPALASVGAAGEKDPITVSGFLRNSAEDNGPVPGVTVTVSSADGEEVGSDETDDQGRFEISFAGKGKYDVMLDTETLPDGVNLREGTQNPLTLTLAAGEARAVNFSIGPDTRDVQTWVDRLPQTIWEGLYFGIVLALGSLGLSMIFGTTGLTNFAHGELLTFGAIVAYFFNATLGIPLVVAGLLAVLASAAFGLFQHEILWRPLRKKGTSVVAMMVVSIGLSLVLRNFFQLRTGGRTLNYTQYTTQQSLDLGLFTASPRDLITLAVAVVAIGLVTTALVTTRLGKATRAVADNPALASATGINVDHVIRIVWIIGTALAGLCGFLLATGIGINFQLGAQLLLLIFAAVILGGLGTVWGAVIGSAVVGVFVEVSTLIIPSELKYAAALFLLIIILLIRPQGLLGRRERIG